MDAEAKALLFGGREVRVRQVLGTFVIYGLISVFTPALFREIMRPPRLKRRRYASRTDTWS